MGTPLGREGEERAARYLAGLGYRILCRNCRSRMGEIDLVAVDGGTLVFVEVKARGEGAWAPPAAHVDRRKRERLSRLALAFLARERLTGWPCRFDVVAVTPDGIEHLRDAFQEG